MSRRANSWTDFIRETGRDPRDPATQELYHEEQAEGKIPLPERVRSRSRSPSASRPRSTSPSRLPRSRSTSPPRSPCAPVAPISPRGSIVASLSPMKGSMGAKDHCRRFSFDSDRLSIRGIECHSHDAKKVGDQYKSRLPQGSSLKRARTAGQTPEGILGGAALGGIAGGLIGGPVGAAVGIAAGGVVGAAATTPRRYPAASYGQYYGYQRPISTFPTYPTAVATAAPTTPVVTSFGTHYVPV